jgi:hypothetical protein
VAIAKSPSVNSCQLVVGGRTGNEPWLASIVRQGPPKRGVDLFTLVDSTQCRGAFHDAVLKTGGQSAIDKLADLYRLASVSEPSHATLAVVCILAKFPDHEGHWERLRDSFPDADLALPKKILKARAMSLDKGLEVVRDEYEAVVEIGSRALVPAEIEDEIRLER